MFIWFDETRSSLIVYFSWSRSPWHWAWACLVPFDRLQDSRLVLDQKRLCSQRLEPDQSDQPERNSRRNISWLCPANSLHYNPLEELERKSTDQRAYIKRVLRNKFIKAWRGHLLPVEWRNCRLCSAHLFNWLQAALLWLWGKIRNSDMSLWKNGY